MNQSRRYLNRGRKKAGDESLLDLFIQHYDELNQLIVLTAEGLERRAHFRGTHSERLPAKKRSHALVACRLMRKTDTSIDGEGGK